MGQEKNTKLNYRKKMLALHMDLKPCARNYKQPMVLLYMVYEVLHMVFKPCARPPKQPMILLYMV